MARAYSGLRIEVVSSMAEALGKLDGRGHVACDVA